MVHQLFINWPSLDFDSLVYLHYHLKMNIQHLFSNPTLLYFSFLHWLQMFGFSYLQVPIILSFSLVFKFEWLSWFDFPMVVWFVILAEQKMLVLHAMLCCSDHIGVTLFNLMTSYNLIKGCCLIVVESCSSTMVYLSLKEPTVAKDSSYLIKAIKFTNQLSNLNSKYPY